MLRIKIALSWALCLMLAVAGSRSTLGQPPTLANTDQPAAGHRVLQLEELWRIGGLDAAENLLGVVDKVLADDQGNLYLLDIQLTEVQVFDSGGTYLRSLGGPGDGPGEIRRATDLVFLPDGTVGLVQGFPGRIVKVDQEGLPAGEFRLGGDDPSAGGFYGLQRARSLGGGLVLSGVRVSRGETQRTATHFISRFGLDEVEQVVYLEKTTVREMGRGGFVEKDEFFPHRGGWTLGPDGQVYVAPRRNSYLVDVYGPQGDLQRSFSRQYESLRRTDEELARARESMIPFRRRNRRAPEVVVEPTERDILEMRAAGGGKLWVLPSRGIKEQPEGIHSTWDVFDPQGVFTETVSVACEGQGGRDALFFVGNGLVVLVKEHAEAMQAFRGQGDQEENADLDARPLEVVCYRIAP